LLHAYRRRGGQTSGRTDMMKLMVAFRNVSFSIEQLTETEGYTLVGFIFRRWKGAMRYYWYA